MAMAAGGCLRRRCPIKTQRKGGAIDAGGLGGKVALTFALFIQGDSTCHRRKRRPCLLKLEVAFRLTASELEDVMKPRQLTAKLAQNVKRRQAEL